MVKQAAARRHEDRLDTLAVDVGKRIRAARKAQGLTLERLGGEDLSRSFLSLVETGHSRISLGALAIIAERLQVPVGELLADTDRTPEILSELLLDEAESKLEQQDPEACLRLLDQVAGSNAPVQVALLRGRAHLARGEAREAIAVLETALGDPISPEDEGIIPHLRYQLGSALYSSGNHDEALLVMRRALEEASGDPHDPMLLGKITVVIGHILFVRGDSGGAISQYERAVDLFAAVRDIYSQGCIYSGLSLAYKQRGDVQSALRYSRLGVGAFRASNHARQMAAEINNVAMNYVALGDLDEACKAAREAVERAHEVHANDLAAMAHSTLARVYLERDEIEAAQQEAEVAEALAPGEESLSRIGGWKTLAEVAERAGDSAQADTLYRRALDTLRSSGQHAMHAETARAYSRLLQKRGDTDRALAVALEALEGTPSR